MIETSFKRQLIVAAWLCALPMQAVAAEPAKPQFAAEQVEFFEREVKPILKANCVACHGAEKKVQGGLHLTSREGVLKGSENGPVVLLDKPEESPLLAAIRYESFEMPPKGKLPQAQIDTLARWIAMGLPWAEGENGNLAHRGPPVVDDAARNFWSFRPVVRPAIPPVKDQAWVKTPIDAYILARLEQKKLRPAPPADKATLLRRAYYSVIGLPPTPEKVQAFLTDTSPDAYEKVVEELLASRHYGEHWGRHWLDLVRYAESNSFERDNPKPFVWRYRDYVIRSLNADKPYDEFIREQLAGDELDEVTADSLIATGYYRLGLWDDEPADPLLAYYDGLDDIVGTTGQTFLGLTVNCCRCHDHKIDPLPQRDYYKFLAFFHGIRHYGDRSDQSVAEASLRPLGSLQDDDKHVRLLGEWTKEVEQIEQQQREIEATIADKLPGGERDDFKSPGSRVRLMKKHIGTLMTQEAFDAYVRLKFERARLERDRPQAAAQALVVKEHETPRETFILLRGNPLSHGDRVEPGFPAVLSAAGRPDPQIAPLAGKRDSSGHESSGRRRVLADWIASPANPLTSRVMANRVFQYHFGRGIVRTSSNFGYMGTPPTHPELLDWLASELVEPQANDVLVPTASVGRERASGGRQPTEPAWSLKHLHRLILLSSAFQMSGQIDPAAAKIDPENDLLSHFDLRRLTAEELRDSILAACGNLHLGKQDGPSIYPVIPKEVLAGQSMPGHNWGRSSSEEAASRSIFVHIKRSLAVPILAAFDAPDPDAPCPVRFATTQPTQALSLVNSEFANSQAKLLAEAAHKHAGEQAADQVRYVLWRVMQREPTPAEISRGVEFIETSRTTDKIEDSEALRRFCLIALNLNEFVYLE
ncbi:MAG: PSD1 and planctomycete cytochrome C domain-containing protein [Planctomycetes bacterium]|nr:PSD1 and planctomycete cytochrome C domain-containing protein [Planctomycetota bacterium]